jgi:hypothetical protein
MLALAQNMPEDYETMKLILKLIKSDSVEFPNVIACDFKMAFILAGVQLAASTHPCTFCDAKK